jgi:hypothetical protein
MIHVINIWKTLRYQLFLLYFFKYEMKQLKIND